MPDDQLSLQYHSLRLYNGTYTQEAVRYRIGDEITIVNDEIEHFYDTWNDFHLIPTERCIVALPNPNVKLVNIPGNRYPIDMTTYLTGHPTFTNRTGSWSFYTDPMFVDYYPGGWIAFDKHLRNLFNGHVAKVVLRDDPLYFYAGELTMGPWQTGADRSTVTISYNFYPYKKSMTSSMDIWKWDDFDFNDGIITYLKDMVVDGSRIVNIYGSTERISPHISGTSGITIEKNENSTWVSYGNVPTQSITSAKSIIPRLIIDDGLNKLRFRGNGTVTVDYRRGLL